MHWTDLLKQNITTVEALKKFIKFSSTDEENQIKEVIEKCPMNIPQYYLGLIDKNDPDDPIKKIIMPSTQELSAVGEFDTSGEEKSTKLIGLQHKYRQTALLLSVLPFLFSQKNGGTQQ